jgi:hypothetical protein
MRGDENEVDHAALEAPSHDLGRHAVSSEPHAHVHTLDREGSAAQREVEDRDAVSRPERPRAIKSALTKMLIPSARRMGSAWVLFPAPFGPPKTMTRGAGRGTRYLARPSFSPAMRLNTGAPAA